MPRVIDNSGRIKYIDFNSTQSTQPAVNAIGVSSTGNTAGNTGTSSGITFVIAGTNGITASQSTSAGGPNTIWLSGSTVSHINGLGVSSTGNTAGNTGTSSGIVFVIAGTNGITASQSTTAGGPNTIWLSGSTASHINGLGVSNTGNTAGNTGTSSGITFVIAGTNGITASQSTSAGGPNTIWLSGSTGGAGAVTFSAGTSSASLGSVVFSNSNNVSFGLNGSTITASVAPAIISYLEPYEFYGIGTITSNFGASTLYVVPFNAQAAITFNQVNFIASMAPGSTSAANSLSVSLGTTGQSLGYQASYTFTNSNLINLYLFSLGGGGSNSDLKTLASTQLSYITTIWCTYAASATEGNSSLSASVSSTLSMSMTFPSMTSATSTSVNNATTVTLWGPGYTNWTGSTSNSTSSSNATSNAKTLTISLSQTWPNTTAWSANKMVPMPFGTSLTAGQYWIGFNATTSVSSSSSSSNSSIAAGRSYTTSVNASNLSQSYVFSYMGATNTIASSIAYPGSGTVSSLAPAPGNGTFTANYAATSTYYNNAGQASGEIALSNINTVNSFWQPWFALCNNRI